MATTITRGATTLHPTDILGWALTRPTRSVVHDVIGTTTPDITARPAGSWRGDLRTYWASRTAAHAAANALAVAGGAWVFAVSEWPDLTLVAQVAPGDIRLEASRDGGGVWLLTVPVVEVSS